MTRFREEISSIQISIFFIKIKQKINSMVIQSLYLIQGHKGKNKLLQLNINICFGCCLVISHFYNTNLFLI